MSLITKMFGTRSQREIKKIQRRKKHYTEIDRDPKEQNENLTDRN